MLVNPLAASGAVKFLPIIVTGNTFPPWFVPAAGIVTSEIIGVP